MTDIEIAQQSTMLPIQEVAAKIGISPDNLELYGKYKAKVDIHSLRDLPRKAKLVLVTAISPTPAGEGKTTTSVGLADALNKVGKKTIVCLREPSLGPVFGVKGGAAGGGYAQVVPMEDINLQPHPAGQRPGHRRAQHPLEARRGYERPSAAPHRVRPGRQGQRRAP